MPIEEMTMGKIKKLSDKNPDLHPFKQEEAMYSEIEDIIAKYSGTMSAVAAIGVFELAKNHILKIITSEVGES